MQTLDVHASFRIKALQWFQWHIHNEEAKAKAKEEAQAKAKAEAKAKEVQEAEAKAKEEAEAKAKAEVEAKAKEEAQAKANDSIVLYAEGEKQQASNDSIVLYAKGEKQQASRRFCMLEKGFPFGIPLDDPLYALKNMGLRRLEDDIDALPNAQFDMLRPTLVALHIDLTSEETTLDLEDYNIVDQKRLVAHVRALKAAVACKATEKALKAMEVKWIVKKDMWEKKYRYVDNRPNYRYRHTRSRPYRRRW